MKEAKKICCGKTILGSLGYGRCGNAAKVERDGKHYCGVHDPVSAKGRREKRNAELVAEFDARTKLNEGSRTEAARIEQDAARYRWLLKNHGLRLADIFHAAMPDEVSDCIDNEIEQEGK